MRYKITYYVNNVPVEKTVEAANQAELRAEIEKLPPGSVRKIELLD